MRKADVVAAQFFRPPEKCLDVFFRVRAAGTIGSFGVNGDTAQKDGLAVEQDLRAACLNGAKAYLIVDRVGFRVQFYSI